MRTLRTRRLRLVPVTERNADQLWAILRRPDLRDFQDLPDVGLAQFRRMVRARPRYLKLGAYGRFEWLIVISQETAPVGWVSLRTHDNDGRTAEIGYSVVREHRGRGVATEAVRTLLREGFARAGIERIRAYCVAENAPSRAVLTNLGFKPDGVLPHGATISGRSMDVLAFALERRTFQSSQRMLMPASGKPA
jgi:RimJ/RimL family protein N-acetyltransferase